MTSGVSSINKVERFISLQLLMAKNRLWVVGFVFLTAMMTYVVIPGFFFGAQWIINIDGTMNITEVVKGIRESAITYYGMNAALISMGLIVLSCVVAIQGFSYLYKMRSVDFFESQPLNHINRFLLNYTNGVFTVVIIYWFALILSVIMTSVMGLMNLQLLAVLILEYIREMLFFLALYSIFVLAAVLSGNVVLAFMMGCFLNLAELIFRLIFSACRDIYFATYYSLFEDGPTVISSPFYWYFNFVEYDIFMNTYSAPLLKNSVVLLVIAVVASAFAFLFFALRPREKVGKGLCLPVVESVIKITIAVALGIVTGFVADITVSGEYNVSIFSFGLIVFVVSLTCVVGEIILSFNILRAFRRAWQIPICIVAVAAVLCFFKFDLSGYDSYVPNPSRVEYAGLYISDGLNSSYLKKAEENFGIDYYSRDDYLPNNLRLDPVAVGRVAEIGMDTARKKKKEDFSQGAYPGGWDAIVYYRLKSGRLIHRRIIVPYDIDENLMNELLGEEEYHNNYFAVDRLYTEIENLYNKKSSLTISYDNRFHNSGDEISISCEQLKALTDAYTIDLEQYDYSFVRSHTAVGLVEITFTSDEDTYGSCSYRLDVFEGFDKTISELKKIDVYNDYNDVEILKAEVLTSTDTKTFTDANQIKQIIQVLDMDMWCEWKPDEEEMMTDCKVWLYEKPEVTDESDPDAYDTESIMPIEIYVDYSKLPDFAK